MTNYALKIDTLDRGLILIAGLISILSCNNSNKEVEKSNIDSSKLVDSSYTEIWDSGYEIVHANPLYIWEVNAEKKTLRKNPSLASMNINADSVINGLNREYDQVKLEKISISNGTITLRINDSDYFTNQMGSSGASQYLAQAVINLTSIPGIKFVRLEFKQGSHASPGTWSRRDFPGYIIIQ